MIYLNQDPEKSLHGNRLTCLTPRSLNEDFLYIFFFSLKTACHLPVSFKILGLGFADYIPAILLEHVALIIVFPVNLYLDSGSI